MEYIIVSAFAMLILLVSISVIYAEYSQSKRDIAKDQIDKIAREISVTAQKIYYMGEPAKSTLEVNFPTSIINICIGGVKTANSGTFSCGTKEIVFLQENGNQIVYSTSNDLLMDRNPIQSSDHKITTTAGLHKIAIEARNNLYACTSDCLVTPDPTNPLCDISQHDPIPCTPIRPGILISQK